VPLFELFEQRSPPSENAGSAKICAATRLLISTLPLAAQK
jgi:hypothetical protein